MKNKLLLFSIFLIAVLNLSAQVPNAFSYQGVARNNLEQPLATQAISIRASIINTSATGTAVYVETHNTTTNAFGLFTLSIGSGTPTTGTFAGIDWALNTKFLKIEMDAAGGSNYTLAGTTQILSVPYAQFAKNSTPQTLSVTGNNLSISGGNTVAFPVGGGGKTFVTLSGDLTNAQAVAKLASEGGVNTQVISVLNCSALTSLDLSAYTNLYSLSVKGNTALTSINLSALNEVASDLTITDNAALTSLNFPSLTYCGAGMEIKSNNVLATVSAPVLKSSGGGIYIFNNIQLSNISFSTLDNSDYLGIDDSPTLTTLSIANYKKGGLNIELCPLLTALNVPIWAGDQLSITNTGIQNLTIPSVVKARVYAYNNINLTTISMAKLNDAEISVSGNDLLSTISMPLLVSANVRMYSPNISTLNLPALTTIKENFNIGSTLLTSITLPALSTFINGASYNQIGIQGSLSSATVNALLAKLVSITPILSGVAINLSQIPSAPPTGQGLTDKATLISRGNTVSTN